MVGINLLQMSLLGAMMVLVICVLRTLLRKHISAKMMMLLWYGAVLRLLLPFSVRLPAAICRWLSELSDTKRSGDMTGHVPETVRQWTEGVLRSENRRIILDGASHSAWQLQAGFVLWMTGMLAVSICFAVNYVRCRRMFKESLPVSDMETKWGVSSRVCVRILGFFRRNVEIRSFDRITSPLTYGIFKPVILLPKKLLSGEPERERKELLQCILLHEGVHIRRYDVLTKLILAVALAVHWFNPAVWLLYRLANRDIEICCDEAVIRQIGQEKRGFYASALLRVEESRYENTACYTCFSRNMLEERIRMIMEKRKRTRLGAVLGGVAVIAICAIFALSMNQSQASDEIVEENKQSAPETAVTEETTVAAEVSAAGTGTAESEMAQFAEQTGEPEQEIKQIFIWPSEECNRVTALYGERIHPITGETASMDHITISGEPGGEWEGTAVCAAADGVVAETGFNAEKGNYIVLEHADGFRTEYTHCKTVETEKGARVLQGDTIGTMGRTGQATGSCLGFYVYEEGKAQNPLDYYPDIEILMNLK